MPRDEQPPVVGDVLGMGRAAVEALDTVKEPVRALFGEAWSEFAGLFGDQVRHWRDMRKVGLADSAVRKIQAKGLSPSRVDPSIIFPAARRRITS